MLRRDFIKLLSVTPFIGSIPIISQQHDGLERLIKHGCNTLVIGPPKCGKTRTSLQLLEKYYDVGVFEDTCPKYRNKALFFDLDRPMCITTYSNRLFYLMWFLTFKQLTNIKCIVATTSNLDKIDAALKDKFYYYQFGV